MSAYRQVTISCDGKGCTTRRYLAGTATQLRERLKRDGWRSHTGTDRITRDYCPRHA